MRLQRILWLLLVLVVSGAGLHCSWRDDLDGKRRKPKGLDEGSKDVSDGPNRGTTVHRSPPIGSAHTAIDVFASRPLMDTYRAGALVIDASTPEFVKYIDGGIRNDWKRGIRIPETDGVGQLASIVRGLAAELYFPIDKDPGGIDRSAATLSIRFTAKSAVAKQLVSVFVNEHKITDLRMPTTDWQNYTVHAKAEYLVEGDNKLRFYFRSAGEFSGHRSAAAFSRFVVGPSIANDRAVNRTVFSAPDKRSSLQTSAAGRLSLFVKVPDSTSTLHIAVAGTSTFSIRIRDGLEEKSIERSSGQANATWQPVSVPLTSYKGRLVRIDLIGEGSLNWADAKITQDIGSVTLAQPHPIPDRIIYWSVSSLRQDRLREDVGSRFRMFAERNFSVDQLQASAPTAGGSHASSMLGTVRIKGSIPDEMETLAEALQSAGYATALISGNGFVNEAAGFSQGFGYYDNPMRRQHHFGASTLWRQAKRFLLQHREQRVFVHVATVEPHVPYRPSTEALRKEWPEAPLFPVAKMLTLGTQIAQGRRTATEREKNYIQALYNAAVADSNTAFAAMLDELKELDLGGTTAIVLAGDHGEELWERGTFGHGSSLYQESLLTPFVIHSPGLPDMAPRRGSSVDIFPTILDLAGVSTPTAQQGMSLLGNRSILDDRPIISGTTDGSRTIRLGDYKLIQKAGDKLELYNLKTDPHERSDIAISHPIISRALRITMATFVAYEKTWSTTRWGQPSAPYEAFASDQGL